MKAMGTAMGIPIVIERQIQLRSATNSDAQCVADILLASRATFLPYAPSPHTEVENRAWVREVLLPAGGVTLACNGEQICGVLAVSQAEGVSWIDQLYLDPKLVGQGIGNILLQHALQTLARPIRLYTFQANTGARRFYERNGFRVLEMTDGQGNEEQCPDVLYELSQ